jgi:transcriptional regulator with XRE-family HTH domain
LAVDAVPNEVLRQLRLKRGWTQGQVADKVREYLKNKYDKHYAIDANRISRLERGRPTWPDAHYREALAAVFDTTTDQLGFCSARTRRDAEVSATKRRSFLTGSSLTALPVLLGLPGPTGRLGHSDVDAFEERINTLARLQRQVGGGATSALCTPEMRRAVAVADHVSMTPAVRARWNAGIARLASTAVWAAFDSGREPVALNLLNDGLTAADEAGDPGMSAFVCEVGARLHVQMRRPEQALDLLGRTRGAIPAGVAATSAALAARAHAVSGDAREVFREIDAADAAFNRSGHDTSVLASYNQAGKHHADVADALFELAGTLGRSDPELLRRLTISMDLLPQDRPRTHAVAAAKMATTLYRMRERETGDHWATVARTSARGITSSRTQLVLCDMNSARVAVH